MFMQVEKYIKMNRLDLAKINLDGSRVAKNYVVNPKSQILKETKNKYVFII